MYRIGELIAHYRHTRGMSQAKLAELVGCSQAQLHRIEKGDRGVSVELLSSIAHQLGIGPATLGGSILVYEQPAESDR